MISKGKVAVVVVFLSILVVASAALTNYFQSVEVSLDAKDISTIEIVESDKTILKTEDQSAVFRLPKFSTATIKYTGDPGFENSSKVFKVGDIKKTLTVRPYFSEERLTKLTSNTIPQIAKAINIYNKDIAKKYKLSTYRLYHYGEWASVELTWKGEYGQNTDSLIVILENKETKWNIVSEPSITFFKGNYPLVPTDILDKLNNS